MNIGGLHVDAFWLWYIPYAFILGRIALRLANKLFVYRFGRDAAGWLNAYGGGDLRRDREPGFFFVKARR